MDYIINKEHIYKKSKALDKLCFSQKKIMKLIIKENLYEQR